jgi:hypothetical protein
MNCALTLIWIFFMLFATSTAQDRSKAERVVEFSQASCEGFTLQLQDFARAVADRPGSKGLAVFYPQKGVPAGALFFENDFQATIRFLRLDESKFKMLLAKPGNSTKVEYWVVPPGADGPTIEVAKPGEIFEGVSAPFVYNTEFGGEVCPAADTEQIAEIIRTNPNVDLRIVVRGKTEKYRTEKVNKWLRSFVVEHGIPRSRVSIFVTRNIEKNFPFQDVEFWFVPVRRIPSSSK